MLFFATVATNAPTARKATSLCYPAFAEERFGLYSYTTATYLTPAHVRGHHHLALSLLPLRRSKPSSASSHFKCGAQWKEEARQAFGIVAGYRRHACGPDSGADAVCPKCDDKHKMPISTFNFGIASVSASCSRVSIAEDKICLIKNRVRSRTRPTTAASTQAFAEAGM